ncbi:MAG: hypothetical protein ACWA41_05615 [Putridiphycobacter sp.]
MTRLLIIILMFPISVLGQKFMIKNGDTLPYKETVNIYEDTIQLDQKTIFPGDTAFLIPCHTFEKVDGQIVNIKTADCSPKGFWIIESDNGFIVKGNYNKNEKKVGTWKTYNQKGLLINEIEYVSVVNDTYVLREVNYKDGKAEIVMEKSWFVSFYLKNVVFISIFLGLAFFSRFFFNCPIYNRINKTNNSPFYTLFRPTKNTNFGHNLSCTFTFWWNIKKLHEQDKSFGRINNVLSIIAIGGFLIIIIGLTITGELK